MTETPVPPSRLRALVETVLSAQWARLSRHEFDYLRADGRWQRLVREVHDHGDGAAILLVDPVAQMVVLTRQFRYPAHLGDGDGMLIEACAGLVDPGDSRESCVIREAIEETGYRPRDVRPAFSAYSSPGAVTEMIHGFIGTVTIGEREGEGGGLNAEGEDIEVLEIPTADALAMLARGEIRDAKTIMLLQYFALERLGGAR